MARSDKRYGRRHFSMPAHKPDCKCAGDRCGQAAADRASRPRKAEQKRVAPVHPNSAVARKWGRTDWL